MKTKRFAIQALALAALGVASLTSAWAQADYPSKPIKLIVAFPPGGTSDIMGRLIAEELGKVLKQAIVVENNVAEFVLAKAQVTEKEVPFDELMAQA